MTSSCGRGPRRWQSLIRHCALEIPTAKLAINQRSGSIIACYLPPPCRRAPSPSTDLVQRDDGPAPTHVSPSQQRLRHRTSQHLRSDTRLGSASSIPSSPTSIHSSSRSSSATSSSHLPRLTQTSPSTHTTSPARRILRPQRARQRRRYAHEVPRHRLRDRSTSLSYIPLRRPHERLREPS
ncbi:hypothetical protein DFP72DRAFT_589719 [Ephemerocybe angulata]|uniref:Uncharacterized protein n=1 Tax=Ephemerocybe angulata TaxID=980116 RepID=A0A8H6HJR1_9AGAR|nr:hypothetical protein DFP72DRAFT_589719 [Tulosesus angulatus]